MSRGGRLAAATLIAAATVGLHVDTAGAAISCSLSVVERDATTMTLAYRPHDDVARTVWVLGQPTTMRPGTTVTVRSATSITYPTSGDVIDVAELVAKCSAPTSTTTTTTTTSTTAPPSTTTSTTSTSTTQALSTVTVLRVTPEPTTTSTAPPAVTTTTPQTTRPTLPETGPARAADVVTVGLWVTVLGFVAIGFARRRRQD